MSPRSRVFLAEFLERAVVQGNLIEVYKQHLTLLVLQSPLDIR